jgi:predicted DNA binding CopG/RHH family protein
MKLDYIANINEHGDNLVRLYDCDRAQAERLRDIIKAKLIISKTDLELTSLDFIEARNCNLTLRLSNEDIGIEEVKNMQFYCDLTYESYVKMVALLEPFCNKETKGHQYLYEVDSLTDLLFSPAGTW